MYPYFKPPTKLLFKARVSRMPKNSNRNCDGHYCRHTNIQYIKTIVSVHPSLDSITFACAACLPARLADGSHHAPLRNLCALVAANSMLGDAGLHRRSAARSCSCARHVACCMSSVCARAVNYKQKSLDIFASHRFVFISRCRLHYDLCKIVNTSDGSNSNNNGNKRAPNSLKPLFPFFFSCSLLLLFPFLRSQPQLRRQLQKGTCTERLRVKCCLLLLIPGLRPPCLISIYRLSPIIKTRITAL